MDQRGEGENCGQVVWQLGRLRVAVSFFCATLLCGCGAAAFKHSSYSPEKTYSVHLEERSGPGYDYLVGAKIFKGGRLIAEEPSFAVRYYDDGRTFETQFRYFEWISENVFRAGWNQSDLEVKDEAVFVRNDTTKILSELVVGGYGELFLVLELQPKSSVKLLRKQFIDVDANTILISGGQFQDGQRLSESYQRFKVEEINFNFCVEVKEDTVKIGYRPIC